MGLIQTDPRTPITLRLGRDLVRVIKRGNPWVFAEALRECPAAPPGAQAVLLDNKRGRPIARGFYDPTSPVAFRACNVDDDQPLDDDWAAERFQNAWQWRRRLFLEESVRNLLCETTSGPSRQKIADTYSSGRTTAFRLFNGEGDGLPGLVVDIYGDTAVMKLDGPGPSGFWDSTGIGDWLAKEVGLNSVYERPRDRGAAGRLLFGPAPTGPVQFLENGLRFTADVVHGQKTGFFLDQRDNRHQVCLFAAGLTVLNLFGYTGGFSVAAGHGGARHVTTVDQAEPAIEVAKEHWQLNGLPLEHQAAVCCDAFEFLADAARRGRLWDLVISDPPSFAPSKASLDKALAAYQKLAAASAAVTSPHGLLALASCSSHVDLATFLRVIEEGISQARRRATVLALHSQPPDHPTPLALPEFRYLKFVLLRVD